MNAGMPYLSAPRLVGSVHALLDDLLLTLVHGSSAVGMCGKVMKFSGLLLRVAHAISHMTNSPSVPIYYELLVQV